MKGKYLNYQFSLFGDFSDISPSNSQTVIDLLSLYKDKNFIPSIFQEIPVGILPAKSNNRIMLSNADGWNMNIGNVRIDLLITYNEKGKYADMDIDVLTNEAKEILNKILDFYKKKANRMALNTTFLVDSDDSKKISDKYVKRGNLVKFYNDKQSVEWEERDISQITENSFDENELINIGTAINKTSGEIGIGNKITTFNNRIIVQFDFNTSPKNTTHRFDNEKINAFFDTAKKYKNDLESNIQEILDNE